jgi:predicted N-acetyltransferase YhbS
VIERVTIADATPGDADALTALTRASKAAWGYSNEFMQRVDPELVVSADEIASGTLRARFARNENGDIVGYYAFRGDPDALVLDSMFVAPKRMRAGVGRVLWEDALETARAFGARAFTFVADPNAAEFYLALGATQTGAHPSRSDPSRLLPTFVVEL